MTVSILIGMCAWRTVEAPTVQCLWETARRLRDVDIDLDLLNGDALITRARSVAATRFLREFPQDVLMTVDSDIAFDGDQLRQVAAQAAEEDVITVGAYPTRSWGDGQITSYLSDDPITFAKDPTPVEITWGASGFMAIPRTLLERMRDGLDLPLLHPSGSRDLQHYPFYETRRWTNRQGEPIELSEDYDFCLKAREVGTGTFVNPAVRLGHIGPHMFRLEHLIWKEPPSVPLRLVRQGVWEALFPPEFAPYTRLKAEPEVVTPAASGSHLSRSERRRQEREARKHEPVLALSR